jgi:hypothetical protein
MVLYWGRAAKRDLYLPDLPGNVAAVEPNFTYIPRAVRTAARRRLARPHGFRPPGRARRFQRSLGLPGLRVRRTRR